MKLFDARPKVEGNPLEKLYTSLRRHPKLEKSFRQLAENSRGGERGPAPLHRDRYRDSVCSRGEVQVDANFVCTDEDSQSIRLEIRRKRSLLLSRLKLLLNVWAQSGKNDLFRAPA